jgi:DNA-binding MarR family transcriptional regulator
MSDVDLGSLDLATTSWLAGSAANDYLLAAVRNAGHPHLRISHGYVFQRLIEAPQTIGEIAEGLGVTQQAASKAVGELTSLGYLTVLPDPLDRRIRRVTLSSLGQEAVSTARRARRDLETRLAAEIGETALMTARSALRALLHLTGGSDAARRRRVKPPSTE